MAGSILTAPSTTLSTNTVWQNELGYTEAARYGYDGVSLTEWESGNTTIPEIAAGSTLEIDGSMCEYASDTALTTTGIADGWCYIKHVVSGSTVTPTLVNTFGTWDTAKQGYYDGSGNRYSLFVMYKDGSDYEEKAGIPDEGARFGYRYYNKLYTGTTVTIVAGTTYGISLTEPYYDISEVAGTPLPIVNSTTTLWPSYDLNMKNFYVVEESVGISFSVAWGSSLYGGKSYRMNVLYKLSL